MSGLFSLQAFTGFGPSELDIAAEPPPLHTIHASRRSGLRARVRLHCPRRPGVYGMVDEHGILVYVGKAKCLRTRLLSYFRGRGRDPRAGKILANTRAIVWEPVPSEFAALLRELELIRRWQPRLNVKDQPRRERRIFVCIGRRPAPYVFVASRPSARALACYGPVPASRTAREAVRRINDLFQLRDCPQAQEMIFAEQQELFPEPRAAGCVRLEIGACLGPCAAACTHTAYSDQLRRARAFLDGEAGPHLAAIEGSMAEAAAAFDFERAAVLRDRLDALQWLHRHLERLRQARERYSFIYPVSGYGGEDRWYLIHQGRVAAALAAPHDDTSRQAAMSRIEQVYHQAGPRSLAASPDEVSGVLLVAAWFRKHPEELERAMEPERYC